MYQLTVGDLVVDVVRKPIKNLHLAVYPPHGRVRVAVPLHLDDEAVRLAVVSKLAWIKQQRAQFLKQDRQTERQYISGESHYFQGNRYLLDVVYTAAVPSVKIRNKRVLELAARPNSDQHQREQILLRWYREQLKEAAAPLFVKWEAVIGVQPDEWRIKQMKTKWGTCSVDARRIWLNLELAKKPITCLEYIVVHELVHLLERSHSDRFIQLMDQFLPSWRQRREELNRAPLAYEHWTY